MAKKELLERYIKSYGEMLTRLQDIIAMDTFSTLTHYSQNRINGVRNEVSKKIADLKTKL